VIDAATEGEPVRDALRDHGHALAAQLGIARASGAALADSLRRDYERWPRRYHDARHLLACLRACAEVRERLPAPCEIAFALWFHDVVYRPWRHDNEARSALRAGRAALHLGLGEAFAERVSTLVLATAHLADTSRAHRDPAVDWVLDIDLGILGAAPEVYDRYERDVRREYFYLPPRTWRRGREAVLRHFLAQPAIYRTAHFHARLEAGARANLERALVRLAA
jgi:predicted metal-dependent HD superfamily phosphohydrolase